MSRDNGLTLVQAWAPLSETDPQGHLGALVSDGLRVLIARREDLLTQIAALENAGIVDASPHWRAGKYLYLIHPMRDGERVREYIGADPDKQADALARIERFQEHHRLTRELNAIGQTWEHIEYHLKTVLTSMGLDPYVVKDVVKNCWAVGDKPGASWPTL